MKKAQQEAASRVSQRAREEAGRQVAVEEIVRKAQREAAALRSAQKEAEQARCLQEKPVQAAAPAVKASVPAASTATTKWH